MNETNEKKLSIFLLLIIGVILVIVFIILGKYVFSTDRYGYTLPKKITKKLTSKVIDYSYHDLNNEEKIKYNEKLIAKDFIIPLNNAISNITNVYNTNLIQSDESKFIFAYTKLKLNYENNEITNEMIKEEINNTFRYEVDNKNFSNYLNSNKYNNNAELKFCLKAIKSKEENNKLYLIFDYLSYSDELCNINKFDYQSDIEGILIFDIDNDKYYISSLKLIEKEG